MAIKFNPFTGNFDLTGSGGGGASYIDGEVQNFSALPQTIGSPAVDSAYLVREAEGTWLLARKPAGIYIRTANTGVRAADWTHAGAFPDVFNDANFLLYDNGDSTRNLQFQLSGIDTGTTRTLTVPNASGRIQVEGQPIGNTTPAAGTFTTLAANNGTLTASAPVLDLAQTWNNAAVAFTALRLDITNTASLSAGSGGCRFLDFRIGGTSQIRLERNFSVPVLYFGSTDTGLGASSTTLNFYANGGATMSLGSGGGGPIIRSDGAFSWSSGTNITSAADLSLARDAADTLAQRRTTNPQTFRLYNTFTDASNHERGFMRWSSNVLQIGTEAAGTGTVRGFQIAIGATNTCSFTAAGSGVAITCRDIIAGSTASIGTAILAGSANFLQQLNGTNAQRFGIFNRVSGTNNVNFERANFRWASDEFIIDAEAGGTGTLRGIKLGSATSSLLGFYGATPVVQQAAVADATDAASTQARLNDLLARVRTLGLIAT